MTVHCGVINCRQENGVARVLNNVPTFGTKTRNSTTVVNINNPAPKTAASALIKSPRVIAPIIIIVMITDVM